MIYSSFSMVSVDRRPELLRYAPGPWDSGEEIRLFSEHPVAVEQLNLLTLARRLNLYHPAFSEHLHQSISESLWYSVDNGRYYLEIRNPNILEKRDAPVDVIDFDDCLFSATSWHKKEYELISTSPALDARGIHITQEEARELYQQSKIMIPGKVIQEPRYTPLLNLLLLTEYAQRLESGISRDEAWQQTLQDKVSAEEIISRVGEEYLTDYKVDQDIVDIFLGNAPLSFTYDRVIQLLFYRIETAHHLKIIATRGTPEGPLGQIYKLHGSGLPRSAVDLILYTNDLKADAILLLSRFFSMRDKCITVYDDNPSEILPYRQLARERAVQ